MQNTQGHEILFEQKECFWQKEAPIIVEASVLLKNSDSNLLYVQNTFRCMSEKCVNAVMAALLCKDVWGNILGDTLSIQYLDLQATKNSVFGQDVTIEIADSNTRLVEVIIEKVMFDDGTVSEYEKDGTTLPRPVLLSEKLASEELAEEYKRLTVPGAEYSVCEFDSYWRCTCGALNSVKSNECSVCNSDIGHLKELLDEEFLSESLEQFKEQQREEQKLRQKAELERIQQAELEAKKEQEELQKKLREDEAKKQAEIRSKKTKKLIIGIGIPIVLIAILFFAYIGPEVIRPLQIYNEARDFLKNGEYDKAIADFEKIPGYKNSEDLKDEAKYNKAELYQESQRFSEAIELYNEISYYKNSDEKAKECEYQWAQELADEENYLDAFNHYKNLAGYSDANSKAAEMVVTWLMDILDTMNLDEARLFADNVTGYLHKGNGLEIAAVALTKIDDNPDLDYWAYNKNDCDVILTLFECDKEYEGVKIVSQFITALKTGDIYDGDWIRENKSLIKTCWTFDFVKTMVQDDYIIAYFLEDNWTTWDGNYYLNFYKDDNGGTSSEYNLPWVEEPNGTKYYDIQSCTYVYIDGDHNVLAKVYDFNITDYDTMNVYCYKNDRTYTVYRR